MKTKWDEVKARSSASETSRPEKSKSLWQSRQETLPQTSEEAESSKLEKTAKTNRKNAARAA